MSGLEHRYFGKRLGEVEGTEGINEGTGREDDYCRKRWNGFWRERGE